MSNNNITTIHNQAFLSKFCEYEDRLEIDIQDKDKLNSRLWDCVLFKTELVFKFMKSIYSWKKIDFYTELLKHIILKTVDLYIRMVYSEVTVVKRSICCRKTIVWKSQQNFKLFLLISSAVLQSSSATHVHSSAVVQVQKQLVIQAALVVFLACSRLIKSFVVLSYLSIQPC